MNIRIFLDAVDRIIYGLEKKYKFNEKRMLQEAYHAIISWLLEYTAPLHFYIFSKSYYFFIKEKSLGFAWYLTEERQLTTFNKIQDKICTYLATVKQLNK